ncbi:hypothetical protein VISI1226_20081 [Vibrio sinaloensis DSM 21326]|uniref:Uncharacterized protein n=1 Tax=Vibrio sinaloensis DSM 21326 TaxID=945550 RepID=E8MBS0_PHOS4|nr:hypothetical protein [Vibrio sinaloensis]EGA68535.1 hypothetical protein VISI1226_20081 [Vibrio sinaloensis DSM 21326]
MKTTLCLTALLFAGSLSATELPPLPSQQSSSPHKIFLSSENDQNDFDTWKVDGGYAYNVFDKIDLYVGARLNNSDRVNETGFLSGVSYQVTPRVSLSSTLHSYNNDNSTEEKVEGSLSAEVSSRVRLTENLDIHATLDYQEWQQEVEFGLGFRF